MALTFTTVSSAVGVTDTSIVVASATSFAAGNILRIENETMAIRQSYTSGTTIPVVRGIDGSVTAAHASGTAVGNGTSLDWPATPPTFSTAMPTAASGWNAQNVTATGATGSTATNLSAVTPAIVLATGTSGAGINLLASAAQPGATYLFKNMTTGVLKIYSVGATINGTTGTTAVSVTATGNLGGLITCGQAGAWQITPIPT